MACSKGENISCKWLITRWDAPPQENITLSWRGGEILCLEPCPHPPSRVIIPGLINCHVHPDFPYFIWASSFVSWIKKVIAFRRTKTKPPTLPQEEALIKAGTVAWGSIVPYPWNEGRVSYMGNSVVPFLEVLGDLESPMPPEGFPLSPHAPYSLSPQLLEKLGREKKETLKAIHLAESKEEVDFVQGKPNPIEEEIFPLTGKSPFPHPQARSPVEYLDALGCLGPKTIAVHAIFVDTKDADILARRGVSVVICPRSNLYLSKNIGPLPLFQEMKMPTGLGTDGLGSCPNLSLWEEMRTLAFYAQEKGWPISPQKILSMGTHEGARILGLEALTQLKPGSEASFLVVRIPASLSPDELAPFILFQGDLHLEGIYIKGRRVL